MPNVANMVSWKRRVEQQVMEIPGVVALSVTKDAIKISIDPARDPDAREQLKHAISQLPNDIPVKIVNETVETGGVRVVERGDKFRPMQGGVAIGHEGPEDNEGGRGSSGLPMNDGTNNWILTAAHLFDTCLDPELDEQVGQPNWYREPYIGTVRKKQPITQSDGNLTTGDFAAIKLNSDVTGLTDKIYGLDGKVTGDHVVPELGQTVTKSGITTGISSGEVTEIDVIIKPMNLDCNTRISSLYVAECKVDSGDSGGSVVVQDGNDLHPAGIVSAKGLKPDGTVKMYFTPAHIPAENLGLSWQSVDTQPEPEPEPEPNKKPSAVMDISPQNPTENDVVTFDGTRSSDPDGEIVSYEWGISNLTRSGPTYKTGLSAGEWDISLTVTDNDGASATATTTLTVTEADSGDSGGDSGGDTGNQDPQPEFNYTPSQPVVGEPVVLDASPSSDPDGTIEQYEWDFGDTGTYEKSGKVVEHVFQSPGEHDVNLRVVDNEGRGRILLGDVNVSERRAGGGGGVGNAAVLLVAGYALTQSDLF